MVRLKLLNEYIILVYIRGKNLRKKRKRKKKEDIGPIEYFDYMQGIKDPLKNIIRNYSNKEFQTIIDDLIIEQIK